jgi:hypothetical protein
MPPLKTDWCAEGWLLARDWLAAWLLHRFCLACAVRLLGSAGDGTQGPRLPQPPPQALPFGPSFLSYCRLYIVSTNPVLQVGLMVERYRNMSQPDWQHR